MIGFEICVSNLQSALTAQAAGAQRIELCAALDVGGLTPSAGLIQETVRALSLPVHVLIRPREGNFVYNTHELEIMLADIRFCRATGVQGVVIGALNARQEFDVPVMKALTAAAAGMAVTAHRAFDYTADPFAALEQLIALGIQRLLSSGQAVSAFEGRFLLKKLLEQAADRLIIMPGAGISKDNIRALAATTGAQEFHFTAKKKVAAQQAAGLAGLENGHWESDEALIREIIRAVN